MAEKTTINIPVKLLIMIWVVVVIGYCSNNMRVSEAAVSECAKPCMPVCLKEEGATLPICEIACENYCKQISGNHGGST